MVSIPTSVPGALVLVRTKSPLMVDGSTRKVDDGCVRGEAVLKKLSAGGFVTVAIADDPGRSIDVPVGGVIGLDLTVQEEVSKLVINKRIMMCVLPMVGFFVVQY